MESRKLPLGLRAQHRLLRGVLRGQWRPSRLPRSCRLSHTGAGMLWRLLSTEDRRRLRRFARRGAGPAGGDRLSLAAAIEAELARPGGVGGGGGLLDSERRQLVMDIIQQQREIFRAIIRQREQAYLAQQQSVQRIEQKAEATANLVADMTHEQQEQLQRQLESLERLRAHIGDKLDQLAGDDRKILDDIDHIRGQIHDASPRHRDSPAPQTARAAPARTPTPKTARPGPHRVPADTHTEDTPADTHTEDTPADTHTEDAPADTHTEDAPVDTHTKDAPADTHTEDAPADRTPTPQTARSAPARTPTRVAPTIRKHSRPRRPHRRPPAPPPVPVHVMYNEETQKQQWAPVAKEVLQQAGASGKDYSDQDHDGSQAIDTLAYVVFSPTVRAMEFINHNRLQQARDMSNKLLVFVCRKAGRNVDLAPVNLDLGEARVVDIVLTMTDNDEYDIRFPGMSKDQALQQLSASIGSTPARQKRVRSADMSNEVQEPLSASTRSTPAHLKRAEDQPEDADLRAKNQAEEADSHVEAEHQAADIGASPGHTEHIQHNEHDKRTATYTHNGEQEQVTILKETNNTEGHYFEIRLQDGQTQVAVPGSLTLGDPPECTPERLKMFEDSQHVEPESNQDMLAMLWNELQKTTNIEGTRDALLSTRDIIREQQKGEKHRLNEHCWQMPPGESESTTQNWLPISESGELKEWKKQGAKLLGTQQDTQETEKDVEKYLQIAMTDVSELAHMTELATKHGMIGEPEVQDQPQIQASLDEKIIARIMNMKKKQYMDASGYTKYEQRHKTILARVLRSQEHAALSTADIAAFLKDHTPVAVVQNLVGLNDTRLKYKQALESARTEADKDRNTQTYLAQINPHLTGVSLDRTWDGNVNTLKTKLLKSWYMLQLDPRMYTEDNDIEDLYAKYTDKIDSMRNSKDKAVTLRRHFGDVPDPLIGHLLPPRDYLENHHFRSEMGFPKEIIPDLVNELKSVQVIKLQHVLPPRMIDVVKAAIPRRMIDVVKAAIYMYLNKPEIRKHAQTYMDWVLKQLDLWRNLPLENTLLDHLFDSDTISAECRSHIIPEFFLSYVYKHMSSAKSATWWRHMRMHCGDLYQQLVSYHDLSLPLCPLTQHERFNVYATPHEGNTPASYNIVISEVGKYDTAGSYRKYVNELLKKHSVDGEYKRKEGEYRNEQGDTILRKRRNRMFVQKSDDLQNIMFRDDSHVWYVFTKWIIQHPDPTLDGYTRFYNSAIKEEKLKMSTIRVE